MIRQALLAALMTALPLTAVAEEKVTLGWGRMLDNDALGDQHDRWHSGSYTISLMRGTDWSGTLPKGFGDLLEYRFFGGTITAADIAKPAAGDRSYAGPLSLGIHTHFDWSGLETNVGVDLVALGPQTGVSRFQSWLHGVLGVDKPDLSGQIGNGFFPTVQAEMGRSFAMSNTMTLRPFVSAQAGVETMVRAGGDIQIGSFGQGGLMLRDDTTGQRYRGIAGDRIAGMTFTLGGDVAHVFSSEYLPAGGAAVASDTRSRLRAGIAWQGQRSSAFYGVTYLAPEFDNQPEGQLLGSVNINLRF